MREPLHGNVPPSWFRFLGGGCSGRSGDLGPARVTNLCLETRLETCLERDVAMIGYLNTLRKAQTRPRGAEAELALRSGAQRAHVVFR